MCSSKVECVIIMIAEGYIQCYHTLSGTDMNTNQLKVLLKFYVWYLQSNIINGCYQKLIRSSKVNSYIEQSDTSLSLHIKINYDAYYICFYEFRR